MGFGKIKSHIPKLEKLRTSTLKERRELLSKATKSLICAICACCLNVLNGVVPLTKKQRKSLVRKRNICIKLIDHSIPIDKKIDLLIQSGNFLSVLLTTILHGKLHKTNGTRTR